MISYVKGELAAIEEQKAIIDVGGIEIGRASCRERV